MDCITFKKHEKGRLEELVGKKTAAEFIAKYGMDIPRDALLRAYEAKLNNTVFDFKEIDKEEFDLTKGKLDEEKLYSPKIQDALMKLNNERKILEDRMQYSKGNNTAVFNRMYELDNKIAELKKTGKLSVVNDITKSALHDWIRLDVFENEYVNAGNVVNAYQELSMLREMISSLLEYRMNKNGELQYLIGNKEITAEAERNLKTINEYTRKLDAIRNRIILKDLEKELGRKIDESELFEYADINKLTEYMMDSSRTGVPIASYIYRITSKANRNAMGEFIETVERPLSKLEKEAGVDLTKESDAEQFLQKDSKGEILPNLLHEYSIDYFRKETELKSKLRAYHNFAILAGFKTPKAVKRKKELIKELNDTYIIADIEKLISKDEKVVNSERERLIKELGEEKAEMLIEEAYEKYDSYLSRFANYKENVNVKNRIDSSKELTDEELLNKIEKYESFNSPIEFMKAFKGGDGQISMSSFNKLAKAPRKTLNGSDTKFYDKRYEALKKDKKKFELLKFIAETKNNLLKYIPEHISDKLSDNYLPEIFDDTIMNVLKGKDISDKLVDKLFRGMTSNEIDYTTVSVTTPDGKKVKKIPIRYVNDKIGDLEYRIRRVSDEIDSKEQLIDHYVERIDYFRKNRTKYETEEINVDKVIEGYKNKIKTTEMEAIELKKVLPKLQEEKTKYVKMKSKDIVKAIKDFSMMAINYKNKSIIQNSAELARIFINEQISKKEMIGSKEVKNTSGQKVKSDKNSNLAGLINYHIDSLIYGEYKNEQGITDKYLGITKEGRIRLKEYKKEFRQLKADYYNGKIDDGEYMLKKEYLEEKISKDKEIKNISLGKAVDTLNKTVYTTSLGWNITSGLKNILFGKLANSIEAAAKLFFDDKALKQAYKLMRSNILKASTGKDNPIAYKNRNLILKMGTLTDLLEDSYGSNRGLTDKQKKLGLLNAMEMQRRGEFYNQGSVLLAYLLFNKTKTKDGKEISLYDAFDKEGNIRKDVVANPKDFEMYTEYIENNKVTEIRRTVEQLVKRLHGNYSVNAPMKIKKETLGRMFMTFKSFMPEGFATRFEKRKFDDELGMDVEGRYRAYMNLGFRGSVETLKNLFMEKYLKRGDKFKDVNISELDLQNMRRNFREIEWGLSMMTLSLIAAMLFEEDDKKMFGMRHTLNILQGMQNDISMFFDPIEIAKMVRNPIPAMSYLYQVFKMPTVVGNYIFSDNPHHDTDYMLRNTSKLFPVAKPFYRTFFGELQIK